MTQGTSPGPQPYKPLKPRPRLFVFLCIVYAVWMIALLVLYFKTVYPRRHPAAAPALPAATDR
jgi:hypothetical protein